MTRVFIAASIDNELTSKEFSAVKRLQEAGCDLSLVYYLQKVPAPYTALPDVNLTLKEWHNHATKMLKELGDKLNLPAQDRFFVDEILGPDEVFDEARKLKVNTILTNRVNELRESLLSRFFNYILRSFKDTDFSRRVNVANINRYVNDQLGPEQPLKFGRPANEETIKKDWDTSSEVKKRAAR